MPLYCYKCHDCKRSFEVRHGMFFENQRCIHCHSDDIFKVPDLQYTNIKNAKNIKTRPGKIVDKYIEDAKKEIKKEKKKFKSEEM